MINIIAAMTKERVIGKDGKIPWRLPEDVKLFKKKTIGNVVVMGRKTYESIPEKFRPLPDRLNVVVSGTMYPTERMVVARDLETALGIARSSEKEVFVIGGSQIYQQALPLAERMHISYVSGEYEGDAYFPEFDSGIWKIEEESSHPGFMHAVYRRI